jgi:hypothetical protein
MFEACNRLLDPSDGPQNNTASGSNSTAVGASERRRSRSPSGKWEYEPKLLPRTTDPLTVAKLRLWSN